MPPMMSEAAPPGKSESESPCKFSANDLLLSAPRCYPIWKSFLLGLVSFAGSTLRSTFLLNWVSFLSSNLLSENYSCSIEEFCSREATLLSEALPSSRINVGLNSGTKILLNGASWFFRVALFELSRSFMARYFASTFSIKRSTWRRAITRGFKNFECSEKRWVTT